MADRDRPLLLSLFEMATPGHLAHGLWTHPNDQRHRVDDLGFWRELGELLEYGTFDQLFLADVLGTYDVFADGLDTAVREAFQVPALDPLIVLGALADVTDHLGLVATFSTTYEPPFPFARRLATLDALSRGRIGWNIVTSYLKNAAENFGLDEQIEHDERYAIADEYLEVLYRLLLGSWDDGAVMLDRERRVFTDPAKVHYIDHRGPRFAVKGPHLVAPTPQRLPVLFQAGTSLRGLSFAARHAEVVFVGGWTADEVRENVRAVRQQAGEYGRRADRIAFVTSVDVVVGRTADEAAAKASEYDRHRTPREVLAQPRRMPELDRYDPGELVEDIIKRKDHGYRMLIRGWRPGQTVRDLQSKPVPRRSGPSDFRIVGGPEEVATALERVAARAEIDGFNLSQNVSFDSLRDFVELVVPVLRRRGLVRESYRAGETLRERIFPAAASPYPDPTHPGSAHRRPS
ncbi:NtaA/DmoA family FMN-dependent monooxygenase [Jiangella endophytica]|uniref:NtaA/DmoA family FMN-dependent monooxygenase n=1 Tax=Jiangella endophytica TaxID=1623398 RepID=UPI000E349720|nr:NtaA/DmoA family FMN-dependent monooxygenase [Jiangella endophytica]